MKPKKVKPARDPRIDLLPGTLRPIAERAGFESVERLLQEYGGQRLKVPMRPVGSTLALRCGEALAIAMSQALGGQRVKIPLGQFLATKIKHQRIQDDGRSARDVAREMHMHVDVIHRIRGRQLKAMPDLKVAPSPRPRDERQMDLEAWLRERASKVA